MSTAWRLAELHRIYDGPLSWVLAEAARVGGVEAFRRLHDQALSRQADRLADHQRQVAIARRGGDPRPEADAGATALLRWRERGLALGGRID